MKLNLGVGREALAGCVNVDIQQYPGVDVLWDLDVIPWPWDDESVIGIRALDIFEHLEDMTATMDECWRVLKPGGELHIRVPTGGGPNHYRDPTHRRGYTKESMDYYAVNAQEYEDIPLIYGVGRWELCQAIDDGSNCHFRMRRLL